MARGAYLVSIAMVSVGEGWAVGANGTILHYVNGAWQIVTSPTTNGLSCVAMISATEGWAVGSSGMILHLSSADTTPVGTATPTATGAAPSPTLTPTATPSATSTITPAATGTPTPTATRVAPTPASNVDIALGAGWNLVSLPFSPTVTYRASDLVASLAQQNVTAVHIARWQDGAWQSYVPGFGPDDFPIEPGRGYFVRVAAHGRWRP